MVGIVKANNITHLALLIQKEAGNGWVQLVSESRGNGEGAFGFKT